MSKINKVQLFFLLSSSIFCHLCFADPSEFLLKSLSRRSLALSSRLHHPDLSENETLVVLTPDERNQKFKKVLEQVLNDVSKTVVSQSFKEEDIRLLNGCLNSNSPLSDKNCNSEISKIGELLLFYKIKFQGSIRTDNPSYQTLNRDYPHAKLKSDTSLAALKSILEAGKIKTAGSGEDIEALVKDVKPFIKSLLNCRQRKNLDTSFFNGNLLPIVDFIDQYVSIPVEPRGEVWTTVFRNESEMEKIPFYKNSGIRLILKTELLKRWDYHISDSWTSTGPNLNFDRNKNGKTNSYGPAEMDEFMKHYSNNNEIVFQHSVPTEMIQEIIVAPEKHKAVSELLKKTGKNIPLRVSKETSNVWPPDWDNVLIREGVQH